MIEETFESPLDSKEIKSVNTKRNHLNIHGKGWCLKLKLQHFGHLMWRVDSLKKTLMLGKIEGKRRRLWQRMRWLASNTDSKDVNLSKLWDTVKDRGAWRAAGHGVSKYHTQLSNWTTVKSLFRFSISSWFSLGRWYVSRNLFISRLLTSLLAQRSVL